MPSKTDNTWTSDAMMNGDIKAIKNRVLNEPNYVHNRDYVDNTPLMTAIEFDHLDLVKFLLKHGADPNVKVQDGYTSLLTAIESEDEKKKEDSIQIVKELIQAGADIHKTGTNGWTPLHMAASRGHLEKARLLIEAGADVNRRIDIDGHETPLMEAAHMGHPSLVSLLLKHGADPSMRDIIHNRNSMEMAQNAMQGADPEVVEVLKNEDMQIDIDELFTDMDLPEDQLNILRESMEGFDMTQNYIDNSNQVVEEGNHTEVIRILRAHNKHK